MRSWCIPNDEAVYAEAAKKLLPCIDFYLRQLEPPKPPKKSKAARKLHRPDSPVSILCPISEHQSY